MSFATSALPAIRRLVTYLGEDFIYLGKKEHWPVAADRKTMTCLYDRTISELGDYDTIVRVAQPKITILNEDVMKASGSRRLKRGDYLLRAVDQKVYCVVDFTEDQELSITYMLEETNEPAPAE